MKSARTVKRMLLFIIALNLVFVASAVAADTEGLLSEMNRKPLEERRKILIDEAKKERVVYYYGSTSVSDMQDVLNGFNKQYPFVEVRYTRLGAPALVSKVSSEYQGGVYNADVVSVRGTLFPELISKTILSKYKSPLTQSLRKGFADGEGYLLGIYATGYTLIYNKTRVRSTEVPKSYEDLLDARWKGRLVMDREEYDWLAGIIDLMGEKKAVAFFKRLVEEQKLAFNRGHTMMTQLVAAGEYDLMVDGYVPNAVQFRNAGAPTDFVLTNPTLIKPPQSIGVTSKAPHPYSAALLVDYHLSKEAQEVLAQKRGHWTTRRDVKWGVEPSGDLHVISPLDWGRRYNSLAELFRKISGQ
jgi:iron(III) transport system substrate-binding protein